MRRLPQERNAFGGILGPPQLLGRELAERPQRREFLVARCWRATPALFRRPSKERIDVRGCGPASPVLLVKEVGERRERRRIRRRRAGGTAGGNVLVEGVDLVAHGRGRLHETGVWRMASSPPPLSGRAPAARLASRRHPAGVRRGSMWVGGWCALESREMKGVRRSVPTSGRMVTHTAVEIQAAFAPQFRHVVGAANGR